VILQELRSINSDLYDFDYQLTSFDVSAIDFSSTSTGQERFRICKYFSLKFIDHLHYFRAQIRNFNNRALQKAYNKCKRITLFFLTYTFLNIFISYIVNYWNSPREERWNPALNKTSTYKGFPYQLWFPFDTSISDGYYWIAFLYQPYAFFFLVSEFFCKLEYGSWRQIMPL